MPLILVILLPRRSCDGGNHEHITQPALIGKEVGIIIGPEETLRVVAVVVMVGTAGKTPEELLSKP